MINENPKLNNYHLTDSRAARLAENRRMLAENRSQSPTSQAPSVPSTSTAESTAGTPQNFISNLIRRLYDRLTGRAGLNGTGLGEVPPDSTTSVPLNEMHATSESSLTGVKRITDTNVSDYGQALLSTSVIKSLPDKPLPPVASPDDRIEIITEKTSNNFKKNGGGIKQSLQKFGQAASRIIKAWREEGERTVAPNDQVDSQPTPKVKDSSYLLDSYNRTGQYSTLKRDSSLDSHFQAKG